MFKFKKLHVQNKRVYMYRYRYSSNSSSLCFMLSSNTIPILWLLHSNSNGYLSINTLLWLLRSGGDGYVNSDISTTL